MNLVEGRARRPRGWLQVTQTRLGAAPGTLTAPEAPAPPQFTPSPLVFTRSFRLPAPRAKGDPHAA